MTESERALLLFLAAEKLDEAKKFAAFFSDRTPAVANLEKLIANVEAEAKATAS